MKNFYILIFFTCSTFLIGQNAVLVPPENIRIAFENRYPNKKPVWNIEYSSKGDDVIFEAKFDETPNKKAYARYDKNGKFKAYKSQIVFSNLPQKAQMYLKTNYGVKSCKTFFSVVNGVNAKSYEAGVIKSSKFYNIIFDQKGEFYKKIQIQ